MIQVKCIISQLYYHRKQYRRQCQHHQLQCNQPLVQINRPTRNWCHPCKVPSIWSIIRPIIHQRSIIAEASVIRVVYNLRLLVSKCMANRITFIYYLPFSVHCQFREPCCNYFNFLFFVALHFECIFSSSYNFFFSMIARSLLSKRSSPRHFCCGFLAFFFVSVLNEIVVWFVHMKQILFRIIFTLCLSSL